MLHKSMLTKVLSGVCTAAMLVGAVSGCSPKKTSSEGSASTTSDAETSEHIELKIVVPYSDDQPTDSSPVFHELQTKTNATFNIEWTPMISYGDKYNVLMNSGALPDVLIVPDTKSSTFLDAATNDQFWALDDYMSSDKYPNFKNFNTISTTNCKTDGKLYVLPRERTVKRKLICYRADWAKAAGLGAPDTVDKIYQMAKAFAAGDYDGNGEKDTIGFLLGTVQDNGGTNIDCLNELIVANGGFNYWGLSNGKITSSIETQQQTDTLKLLRKMVSEGLVSKDFAITKTTAQLSDYVQKEKAGLWMSYSIPGETDALVLAKQKADPAIKRADLYGFTYLKDSSGNYRIPAETGYNGGIAFPKSSVKNEARLKQLLKVFDYIASKDGQRLINNGIENRQYIDNGDGTCKAADPNNIKALNLELKSYNQMSTCGNYALSTVNDAIGLDLETQRKTYKDTELINDFSAPLISDTYSNSGSDLAKAYDTAEFQFILGDIDESAYQNAVKAWKSNGGDKMSQEYTDSYNKSKK